MFQRRSKFSSEISSGGVHILEKLVPGGTNLGGSIFAVTGPRFRGDTWSGGTVASFPGFPREEVESLGDY